MRDWGEALGTLTMFGIIDATSVNRDLGSPAAVFWTGAGVAGTLVRRGSR
ncbi:hypothetical protein [Streptomyces luteolus]|uniref:Uncharacterized protein n=1 Tax=Streptomyces luteolus TaxID=3043615 RepID=A0ABT6T2A9_9ACTN|nr:hypothetical protein [Streptomyces sp. B-S-A12]MDI3422002.1 hypothetical protein [Streptomyces sp. B-S-A12]